MDTEAIIPWTLAAETMTAKIKMMFQLMEYDELSDWQHDMIISFEKQFNISGRLSDYQFEILSDIFKQASEKVEWSR